MALFRRVLIILSIFAFMLLPGCSGEKGASLSTQELRSMNTGSTSSEFTMRIWEKDPPDFVRLAGEETVTNREEDQNEFGLNRAITMVSQPEITVFMPEKGTETGIAVLIFPGGGYSKIVIDKEGYDVARSFSKSGITAIVLKYRTQPEGIGFTEAYPALSDAKRAMRIVRSHAQEWNIQPDKVGVIGFSAGGNLAAMLAQRSDTGIADDPDPVQRLSCRPDFVCNIYPSSNPSLTEGATSDIPPTFIVMASDDPFAAGAFNYFTRLRELKVPVELHYFQGGGHGFGLALDKGSVSVWPALCEKWIKELLKE